MLLIQAGKSIPGSNRNQRHSSKKVARIFHGPTFRKGTVCQTLHKLEICPRKMMRPLSHLDLSVRNVSASRIWECLPSQILFLASNKDMLISKRDLLQDLVWLRIGKSLNPRIKLMLINSNLSLRLIMYHLVAMWSTGSRLECLAEKIMETWAITKRLTMSLLEAIKVQRKQPDCQVEKVMVTWTITKRLTMFHLVATWAKVDQHRLRQEKAMAARVTIREPITSLLDLLPNLSNLATLSMWRSTTVMSIILLMTMFLLALNKLLSKPLNVNQLRRSTSTSKIKLKETMCL